MPPIPMHRAPAWAWAATALIALLLCIATLSPSVPAVAPPGFGVDKVQHFIGFALLAMPLGYAYPRWTWAVIGGATLFGGAIELIQPLFGRGCEVADLIADGLGAATGALAMRALRRKTLRETY